MVLHAILGFQEVKIWVLEENSSALMSLSLLPSLPSPFLSSGLLLINVRMFALNPGGPNMT
jgi:hypothetical protein